MKRIFAAALAVAAPSATVRYRHVLTVDCPCGPATQQRRDRDGTPVLRVVHRDPNHRLEE